MTPPRSHADRELIEKLVLGELPVAEAERLARELADDSRVAAAGEAAEDRKDTLLDSLRHRQTQPDSNVDQLVDRLLRRLQLPEPTGSSTGDTKDVDAIAPVAPQPIPEYLEYFQIQKVLGEGGMGTVYLADDTRLGRRVALKTLKRELADRAGGEGSVLPRSPQRRETSSRSHYPHLLRR